jgi:hypothetical protein
LAGKGSLDVIYSHLGLINVDLELATNLGGANLAQAKKNFISIHKRLSEGLNAWPAPGLDDTDLSESSSALELHRA